MASHVTESSDMIEGSEPHQRIDVLGHFRHRHSALKPIVIVPNLDISPVASDKVTGMFSAINSLREIPRSGATFTVASWNFLVQLSSSA
jgi:hypothetical protein